MIVSKIQKLTVRRVLSYVYILSIIGLNFCFNLLIIAPFTSQAANDNVTSEYSSKSGDDLYVGFSTDISNRIENEFLTPEPVEPMAVAASASVNNSDTSVSNLITSGSFIIDMGITPQSIDNGVKPYGLIYALIDEHQVPIEWVIKNSKIKDGIDFSHNGKDYRGGPFIIREEFLDSLVLVEIADWVTTHGVVVDTTIADIWVPVRASLSALPFWTLEESGGSGTTGNTFSDAGIPSSAYEEISLDTLNECSSILFTDHANSSPSWSDYSRLFSWTRPILNGGRAGYIAAIGKPAELIENIEFILTSDSIIDSVQYYSGDTLKLQFLTTNGMKEWNSSTDDPVGKYVHQYSTDGEMQFVDSIDALGLDGANKVFIPDSSTISIWRSSTRIGVYDEDNGGVQVGDDKEAAIIVYGPAKGEADAGQVLYLGNFSNTGNNAAKRNDRIIMERAFYNFSFLAAHSKNPKVETHNLSGVVSNGDSVSVVITTNEEDSAEYSFSWTTNGIGGFDDSTLQNPTYFFGAYEDTTTVVITVNMLDGCGRIGFLSFPVFVVPIAPGGVKPNLNLWLKADKGVTAASPVTLWEDQSVQGHDAIDDDVTGCDDDDDDDDCVGVGPILVEKSINCNPSLRFDTLAGMYVPGGILGDSVVDEVHTFVVAFEDHTSRVKWLFRESATDKYSAKATGPEMELSSPALTSSTRSGLVGDSLAYIATFNRGAASYGTGGVKNKVISHNAKVIAENTNTSSLTGTDSDFDIGNSINAGGGDNGVGQNFDGNIAEIISYDGALTPIELNRIESYLALKYGITLDQTTATDYTASDGTTEMWNKDATDADEYDNDIAGIGRDAGSALSQVKSKSVNYDAIVLLLAEDEGTNAIDSFIDIVDMEFFTFGNNDSAAAWTTTDVPPAYNRLKRVWKVQEVGEVGTLKLTFDVEDADFDIPSLFFGSYYFVHDADTDGFLGDESPVEMTDEGGGLWSISGIDMDDGELFSILGPAGIVWDGNSWTGGASTFISGGPSDELEDAVKPMIIMAGDTAKITEKIDVGSLQVDSNAILEVLASQCMIVGGSVTVHDSANVILTATSDSTYAQYHGAAMANTTAEMMLEHYDWHQIASPVGGTTLADLEAENSSGGDGYIVYAASHLVPWGDTSQIRWYETQDYNGGTNIGYGADSSYSDAFGTWYGGKSTDVFDGTEGYMIFVNATLTQDTPLPLKLKIKGTTNDSSRSTSTDIDNYGWTMVSNPYPCAIDWEVIEARLGTATNDSTYDFLPTVSIWEPANQNYATYLADGAGTSGVAANNNGTGVDLSDGARYIAPFQSFWVQRSDHVGEDDGSSDAKVFKVLPTDRVECEKPKHFKQAAFDYQVMRIQLSNLENNFTDELLVRFGEQFRNSYSTAKDAHKLSSANPEVALVSTRIGGKSLVIHSRSIPEENTSIPLWIKAPLGAKLSLKISDMPSGWSSWIVEVETGNTFPMENGSFEYINFLKENNHRFDLIVKDGMRAPIPISANVFTRDNAVDIEFDYPGVKKKVVVTDLLGRIISSTVVVNKEKITLQFGHLAKQTYLIHVISNVDSNLYKVIP